MKEKKQKKNLQILRSDYKTFFFPTHMECQNAMQNHPFQSKKWDSLTRSTLGKFFIRQHFELLFFLFSQKTGFDISCMKCQHFMHEMSNLFLGKIRKKVFQNVV